MPHPKRTDEGLLVAAWQEQLAHASKNPFLLNLLLKQWQRVLKRLAYFYAQLASLPRRNRRALQRALATSLIGAAMLLALSSAPLAFANNLSVDKNDTVIANDGFCSLAEAIINANNDSQLFAGAGECPTGDPGPDTITLMTDVTLGALLPSIDTEIILEGNNFFVSGNNTFQVFYVWSSGDFTINDTTIQDGYAISNGGGINNSGTLTLNDSTLSGNSAAGLGGAIYNDNYASVTITNSTLSGNSAGGSGGAIYNDSDASLTITNSTLSGNTASRYGGGIYNDLLGSVTINNSTLTANHADLYGGALYNTFAAVITLNRTLVSGNTAGTDGNEIANHASGTLNANNYNLFGHSGETNTQAFTNFTPGLSDIVATSDGTVPTALANIVSTTLGNNGGPTQTLALVTNSPAIDGAPNMACSDPPINGVDQRGLPRNVNIFNGNPSFLCDIGAFELQATTAVNVTNLRGAAREDKNVLRWKTATESQIAGFDVYRKTHKGEWQPVNANFIQAKNAGSVQGNKYRFADKHVKQGKTYRYKLQVKYLDGHTEWTDVIRVRVK